MSSGKTAIVIGATGLVGTTLVEQLVASPLYREIKTFTRRKLDINSAKLTQSIVDFDQLLTWQTQLRGDDLFCCLGTTIKQAGSKPQQTLVDLEYPSKIAKAAVKNGVSQALLVSSSGANKNAKSFYFKLKGQLEQNFIDAEFQQLIIVRPSVLTGQRAEFRIGERIAEVVLNALKFLPWIKRYRPISGAQVAKAMITLANTEHSKRLVHRQLDQLFK